MPPRITGGSILIRLILAPVARNRRLDERLDIGLRIVATSGYGDAKGIVRKNAQNTNDNILPRNVHFFLPFSNLLDFTNWPRDASRISSKALPLLEAALLKISRGTNHS